MIVRRKVNRVSLLKTLEFSGYRLDEEVLIVRHATQKARVRREKGIPTLPEIMATECLLEVYQGYQQSGRFKHATQIVSCYSRGATPVQTVFYGVFDVLGNYPATEGALIAGQDWLVRRYHNPHFEYYCLRPQVAETDLSDQCLINWGGDYRRWIQPLKSPGRVSDKDIA